MAKERLPFNPKTFLATVGVGREMMSFKKGQTIYSLNDAADALFVIQEGKVKLSVRPPVGKEAILDILSAGDFVGKDAIAGQSRRTASASAMTNCNLLRIKKKNYAARPDNARKAGKYVLGIRASAEHPISARLG